MTEKNTYRTRPVPTDDRAWIYFMAATDDEAERLAIEHLETQLIQLEMFDDDFKFWANVYA